jgi:hypothetical protein
MSGNGEPSWYQPCQQAIAKLGGTMCPDSACNNTTVGPFLFQYCSCQPPYRNGCTGSNPPLNCCVFTAATPVLIASQNCYCCCGWSMPSAAADAENARPVKDYQPGDPIYVAIDVTLESWETRPVAWSGGVAAAGRMVRVVFGDESDRRELVVDRAHLFLTPERTLKGACELVAGEDALVAADGSPRDVVVVQDGIEGQELHHVATSTTATTSPEGHLVLMNGVVCGDWALQVGVATGG